MKDTTVLDSLVGNASHISIVVHTHPDGDAIGSGTAMLCYLTQSRGKDAALIVPDSIPDSISFITRGAADGSILVFDEEKERASARINASDLIICLDCNSFSRTSGMEDALRQSKAPKVLIDHHLNPDIEAFTRQLNTEEDR